MNKTTIAGHLGADPEVRFTSTGKKVTTLRVAARTRKGAQDDTIWWKVTIWGEQFDKMISFFKKGSPIIVYGELLKPEIFQDREGKSQISMELRAIDLQFSPFGKPEQRSSESHTSSAAAPFGIPQETPLNPYGSSHAQEEPVLVSNHSSFDDEVPF